MKVYVVRNKENGDIPTISLKSECLAVFKSKEGAREFLSSPWVVDEKAYSIDKEYYPDIIIENKRYVKKDIKGATHYIPFRTYILERGEKVSFLNGIVIIGGIVNFLFFTFAMLAYFSK